MPFKTLFLVNAFLFVFFTNTAQAQMSARLDETTGLTWYSSLAQAHELSQTSKKPIFAFFTGSDWCGWCIKLQKNVFSKPEFIEWAKKNVILLELDFPRRKELPAELVQQNAGMQQALQVSGYPTVWLLNTVIDEKKNFNLNPIGSLGYPQGAESGKEQLKFISDANAILANKK